MLPNGGEDLVGNFEGDLAAVGAVHLIAIVFGRVVAGRDADAGPAAEIPHGPGEGGGGLKPGIQTGRDAVGREDAGGFPGEKLAAVAAVMRDGNLFGQFARVEVIG